MSKMKTLKDAPRDGTPIIMLEKGYVRIVVYGDFEKGYDKVEQCDGGFYDVGDMSDIVATVPSNGDVPWIPLTDKQVKAVLKATEDAET